MNGLAWLPGVGVAVALCLAIRHPQDTATSVAKARPAPTAVASAPAPEARLRAARRMAQVAESVVRASRQGGGLANVDRDTAIRLALSVLAAVDPDRTVSLARDLLGTPTPPTERQLEAVVQALVLVPTGLDLARRIDAARPLPEKLVAQLAVGSRAGSPATRQWLESKLTTPSEKGVLALALLSLEYGRSDPARERLVQHARSLAARVPPAPGGSRDYCADLCLLVCAWARDDRGWIREFIRKDEPRGLRLLSTVSLILSSRNEPSSDGFDRFVLDDLVTDRNKRFDLAARTTPGMPVTRRVREVLLRDFDPARLAFEDPEKAPHPVSELVCGTFALMREIVRTDPDRARTIQEAISRLIVARKDARRYYHMVGTSLAILATSRPLEALARADVVHSLEWSVNAHRSIYRMWAETDPRAALDRVMTSNLDRRGRPTRITFDLAVEAAVGASRTRPDLAMEFLSSLPDDPDRFDDGVALVATVIARSDPERAVTLLLAPPRLRAMALVAFARIAREWSDPSLASEFPPDALRPVCEWPGPFLSRPLRFRSVDDSSAR